MKESWDNKKYVKQLFKENNFLAIYKADKNFLIPEKVKISLSKEFSQLEEQAKNQMLNSVEEYNGIIEHSIKDLGYISTIVDDLNDLLKLKNNLRVAGHEEIERAYNLLRIVENNVLENIDFETYGVQPIRSRNLPSSILFTKRFLDQLSKKNGFCDAVMEEVIYRSTAEQREDSAFIAMIADYLTDDLVRVLEAKHNFESEFISQLKEEKEKQKQTEATELLVKDIIEIIPEIKNDPINPINSIWYRIRSMQNDVFNADFWYMDINAYETFMNAVNIRNAIIDFANGVIKLKDIDINYFSNDIVADGITRIALDKFKDYVNIQTAHLKDDESIDEELLKTIKAQEEKIIQQIEEKKQLSRNKKEEDSKERINSAVTNVGKFEV